MLIYIISLFSSKVNRFNKNVTKILIFSLNIPGGDDMNSCELTSFVTAVANALSCKLTDDQLTLLASVLVQLGDTLVTIVTQRAICEKQLETK